MTTFHATVGSQGINSDTCDKCGYHGTHISSMCQCGERHYWCYACWQHDLLNMEAEEIYD